MKLVKRWRFDMTGISEHDWRRMVAISTDESASLNDAIEMGTYFARVVRAMPYKGDVTDPETYRAMPMAGFMDVTGQVMAHIKQLMKG
jgi:hypothetical protein